MRVISSALYRLDGYFKAIWVHYPVGLLLLTLPPISPGICLSSGLSKYLG